MKSEKIALSSVGTSAPTILVRPEFIARAAALGTNFSDSMAAITVPRVSSETNGDLFQTRETVATDTLDAFATSRMLARFFFATLVIGAF
jgi:hypothetical protein